MLFAFALRIAYAYMRVHREILSVCMVAQGPEFHRLTTALNVKLLLPHRQSRCTSVGIPRLPENPKTPLAKRRNPDSTERMIRPGFLDRESRQDLIELARNGSAAHRLARRANALVLLDDGMSCEAIAKVLLLDDDTIRTWYRLYEEDGIEGLTNFGYEGSAC
jgi:hypothetical protein